MIYIDEWKKLPRLVNEDEFHKKLKIGDRFVYGQNMIGQFERPLKEGDRVHFFVAINIKDKSCEYMLKSDFLKNTQGEEIE